MPLAVIGGSMVRAADDAGADGVGVASAAVAGRGARRARTRATVTVRTEVVFTRNLFFSGTLRGNDQDTTNAGTSPGTTVRRVRSPTFSRVVGSTV